ncbi:MAG: MFS transporter [Prevotellaceae bacterium]|jgi:FHS family L-fucose permease-like MFS transporter|nr:MFS transporter [Prevotellaceae bacterium]
MTQKKQNGNIVAIVMMIALFGMIGFVTNLAAPAGTIWKNQYEGSNFLGMLGNLMNFAAYLVMGIPAGKLLTRLGYKKTALFAIVIGFAGIGIQFFSSIDTGNLGFAIYLAGAFIAGICVCMLNTVVNPMLNEIGGGGKKGGALLQTGGACNSLLGTLAPILVGALIGEVTKKTAFSDVNPVLFIAMGIFAVVGVVLYFVNIPEPAIDKTTVDKSSPYSAWSFRHFVLGAIGIFIYVGVEVGIPGTMKFFLETADFSFLAKKISPVAAGTVAGTYWFLMLVGRLAGAGIARKVSSKVLLTFTSGIAIVLVLAAIIAPSSIPVSMPVFTGDAFAWQQVPINALFIVLVGLCTSVMWGGIFNLAVEGLGKYVTTASGIFMMMVVGGGILPLLQNGIVDITGKNYMISYLLPLAGLAYLLFYALAGSKNVNKDIPVE